MRSIHRSDWPVPNPALEDERAEEVGQILVEIATAARRYKSEASLSLGAELDRLQLAVAVEDEGLVQAIQDAAVDLKSVSRARQILVSAQAHPEGIRTAGGRVMVTAVEITTS